MQKEFPCDEERCGHTIVAISPDDHHQELVITPCCENCIKKIYECDNCHQPSTRYWCHRHPSHAVGPITGSFKSDLLKDRDIYGTII